MASRLVFVDKKYYDVDESRLDEFTKDAINQGYAPQKSERVLIGGEEKIVRSDDVIKWRKRFGAEGLNIGFETFAEREANRTKILKGIGAPSESIWDNLGAGFNEAFWGGGPKRAIEAVGTRASEGQPLNIGGEISKLFGKRPSSGLPPQSPQDAPQRDLAPQSALSTLSPEQAPVAPVSKEEAFRRVLSQISQPQPMSDNGFPQVQPRSGTNVPEFNQFEVESRKISKDRKPKGDNFILRAVKRGLSQADLSDALDQNNPDPKRISEIQKHIESLPSTPEMELFTSSKGTDVFKNLAKGFHVVVPELIIQSGAAMLKLGAKRIPSRVAIGTGAGAGLGATFGGGVGAIPGAGVGFAAGLAEGMGGVSLSLETSGDIIEAFHKAGIDTTDPEQLEKVFTNKVAFQKLREQARVDNIPIAVFDGFSTLIAGRLFRKAGKTIGSKFLQGLAELGVQGTLGGGGEAAKQAVVGEGFSLAPIVAEVVAEIGSAPGEIAVGKIVNRKTDAALDTTTTPPTTIPDQPAPKIAEEVVTPQSDAEIDAEIKAVRGDKVVTMPEDTAKIAELEAEKARNAELKGVEPIEAPVTPPVTTANVQEKGTQAQVEPLQPAITSEAQAQAVPPKQVKTKAQKVFEESQIGVVDTESDVVEGAKKGAEDAKKGAEKSIALNNASINVVKEIYNLPGTDRVANKKVKVLLDQAINEGEVERAEQIADEVNVGHRTVTSDKQQMGMGIKLMELTERIKEAKTRKMEAQESGNTVAEEAAKDDESIFRDRMASLTTALEITGTEWSSSGRVRQLVNAITADEVESIRKRAKDSIKGEPTRKQNRELGLIDKLADRLDKSKAAVQKLRDKIKKIEETKIVQEARRGFVIEANKQGRKINKSKAQSIRTKAINDLKKLGFAASEAADITRLVEKSIAVPPQAIGPITNLIKSYIMDGIIDFDVAVEKAQSDIPSLEKFTIYDILASRTGSVRKRTRTLATKTLSQFREQARLAAKITDVTTGTVDPKRGKQRTPTSRKALRKLLNNFAEVISKTTPDMAVLEAVQKRMDTARDMLEAAIGTKNALPLDADIKVASDIIGDAVSLLKTEEKINELEEALNDPEKLAALAVESPKQKAFLSEELRAEQSKLADLRSELNERVKEIKGLSWAERYIKFNRFMMSVKFGLEWSFIMRQGYKLTPLMPLRTLKAIRTAYRSINADEARNIDAQMRAHVAFAGAIDSELRISKFGAAPSQSEEMLLGTNMRRMGAVGRWYAAMERGNVNALNFLRFERYLDKVRSHPDMTFDDRVRVSKSINDLSGAGNLKGKPRQFADAMGTLLTAPNYLAAEFSSASGITFVRAMRSPAARSLMLGATIRNGVQTFGLMGLAAMAGAQVFWDLDDSDWGKIVWGKYRFNPWGPAQGIWRLIFLYAFSTAEQHGLKAKQLRQQIDAKDAVGRILRYRIAPVPAGANAILSKKDFIGRPLTYPEAVYEATFNAFLSNVAEGLREEGITGAAVVGPPEFFGISTSVQGGLRHQIPKRILISANKYNPQPPQLVDKGRTRKKGSMELPRWIEDEDRFARDIKEAWGNGLAARIIANESDLKDESPEKIQAKVLEWSQEIKKSIADGLPEEKPEGFNRGNIFKADEVKALEKEFPRSL